MKCRHTWNVPDPQPNDAFCTECGQLFTGKGGAKLGRPRKKDAAQVLAEAAGDLAGVDSPPKFGGAADDLNVKYDEAQAELSMELPKPQLSLVPAPPPTWCKMAGKRISQAYVMLIEGACARFAKRQTSEPEDEDVTELGNALGEQMAIWFPDTEMTPATKIAIAAASVAATMVVGSKPIAPPVRSVSTPKATADVALSPEAPTENGHQPSTSVGLPRGLL